MLTEGNVMYYYRDWLEEMVSFSEKNMGCADISRLFASIDADCRLHFFHTWISQKFIGMPDWQAYRNGNARKGYWAVAGSGILTLTFTNERLERRGYYDMSEACILYDCTAVYRSVSTVV